jgi:5-methyltetrahydropteroyltriglutamate--homocysteine methyltransferase
MSLSTERQRRIVTTHVGSLPRPISLSAQLLARMSGQNYDADALAAELHKSVGDIVTKQAELGVDVVSDGELSKTSFQYYVTDRLSGKQLQQDIDNFKAGLAGANPVDKFMPSVSPSSCVGLMENRYYGSDEEHLHAVAEALREEYQAIVAAGFIVQIDDPRLAMNYMLNPALTIEQQRAWARQRIEALNHALRGLPEDRVRHHTCYGINQGPRTSDLELKHLADLIVTIKAGYYSFELANPRHEHEWKVWETVNLPDGKVLMPGCITHASVIVEHPELVAERLLRLAGTVGRDRVMASSDCGFASTLSLNEPPEIEPEIVWAKFKSLAEGARLASQTLWR